MEDIFVPDGSLNLIIDIQMTEHKRLTSVENCRPSATWSLNHNRKQNRRRVSMSPLSVGESADLLVRFILVAPASKWMFLKLP